MPSGVFHGAGAIVLRGRGVHTAQVCEARVAPSVEGQSLRFVLEQGEIVPDVHHLHPDCRRATDLRLGAVRLGTVEHFLAAACAVGLPSLSITVNGPELPILDGSSSPVYEVFLSSGLQPGFAFVELETEVFVDAHGGWARLRPVPLDGTPTITAAIDLGPRAPAFSTVRFLPGHEDFGRHIAPARTFCRLSDVEALRAAGLIRGGDLGCALVLDETGPICGQDYRLPDEPVRHKILDAIGDLSLLGGLPWADIELFRPGHALMHEVVRQAAASVHPRGSPWRSGPIRGTCAR